jgi:hypothetical protein
MSDARTATYELCWVATTRRWGVRIPPGAPLSTLLNLLAKQQKVSSLSYGGSRGRASTTGDRVPVLWKMQACESAPWDKRGLGFITICQTCGKVLSCLTLVSISLSTWAQQESIQEVDASASVQRSNHF